MLRRTVIAAIALVVSVFPNVGLFARTYEYVEQVGEGKEHATINSAIVAMKEKVPPLSASRLGCIEVYPRDQDYEEQLNEAHGGHDLPAHCDLTGICTVRIKHQNEWPFGQGIYEAAVDCEGDNVVYNITTEDIGWDIHVQNSICFRGTGTLDSCKIYCHHGPAVTGKGHLIVKGSNTYISSYYFECIKAESTFEIYDCKLEPRGDEGLGKLEWPKGIKALGSGIIDGVFIESSIKCGCYSSSDYYGAGVYGIEVLLDAGEQVVVSGGTKIDLTLESKYYDSQTATLRLCGILSGEVFGKGGGNYPGSVVVRDCEIVLKGIKGTGGAGDVKVDGVCVRGGGTVQVHGVSEIRTERDPADSDQEKLLRKESGSLSANLYTVYFNPNGDAAPDCYNEDYVVGTIGKIDGNFCVKDSSGISVACFDIWGNLLLKGAHQTWQGPSGANDEFIVENSGGPVAYINESGNLYTQGSVSQYSWHSASGSADEFRVQNPSGSDVVIIDGTNGNVYLKGKLKESWDFCQ